MTLDLACRNAIALTRQLHQALAGDDLALCESLLIRRADAMVQFENSHRAAGDPECTDCRALLLELQECDRQLQERAAEVFALAGQAFHAQMGAQRGQAAVPSSGGSYDLLG